MFLPLREIPRIPLTQHYLAQHDILSRIHAGFGQNTHNVIGDGSLKWYTSLDNDHCHISDIKFTLLNTLNKKSLNQPGDSMFTVLHWKVFVQ